MDVEVLGLEDLEVEVVVLDLVLAELGVGGRGEKQTEQDDEGESGAARGESLLTNSPGGAGRG